MAIPFPTKQEFSVLWSDPDMSVRSIARKFFVSEHQVCGWAKKFGFQTRGYDRPSLDRIDAKSFKDDWAAGVPVRLLRKKYCVGSDSIIKIAARLGLQQRNGRPTQRPPVVRFDIEEGPRPGDPSPEEIARWKLMFRQRHIERRMQETNA